MTNKEKYRQLCKEEAGIPVFAKDWWLDATSGGGGWDVAIYEENGEVVASWPYFYKQKWGFKIITTAILTKYQGIWMREQSHDLIRNKIIVRELLAQLPKVASYAQLFSPRFTNWLPLHWDGFKQTTRYTFVIDNISNKEKVLEGFSINRRKDIARAQKYFKIEVGFDALAFYKLREKNLADIGEKIAYTQTDFLALAEACKKNSSGEFLVCKDEQNRIVSYCFIVWDELYTYFIISGFEPELCKKGASDLMVYETIKFASTKSKSFDFEGSMDKGIAHNVYTFAEKQIPYFLIYKDSFLFKALRLLKNDR